MTYIQQVTSTYLHMNIMTVYHVNNIALNTCRIRWR